MLNLTGVYSCTKYNIKQIYFCNTNLLKEHTKYFLIQIVNILEERMKRDRRNFNLVLAGAEGKIKRRELSA